MFQTAEFWNNVVISSPLKLQWASAAVESHEFDLLTGRQMIFEELERHRNNNCKALQLSTPPPPAAKWINQ